MIAPREAFARFARTSLEGRREWDSPHVFASLHWDGRTLRPGLWLAIMTDIDPARYPGVMASAADRHHLERPGDPAVGYMLMAESFGTIQPGHDATAAEREQYERDRRDRTFHLRQDSFEELHVFCADVHGRLWHLSKHRDNPGEIRESFSPPGPMRRTTGSIPVGLLSVAYATGMKYHGLPGPQGSWN